MAAVFSPVRSIKVAGQLFGPNHGENVFKIGPRWSLQGTLECLSPNIVMLIPASLGAVVDDDNLEDGIVCLV